MKVDGKFGFINKRGSFVLKPAFDDIWPYSDGLAAVRTKNKMGFLDRKFRMAIQPRFDNASSFSEGLAAVQIGKKYGFINREGNLVIKPQFDDAESFYGGLSRVWTDVRLSCSMKKLEQGCALLHADSREEASPCPAEWVGKKNCAILRAGMGYIDARGHYIWKPTAVQRSI